MERLFPIPGGDRKSHRRDTHVLWDMNSCEPIPENPYEMKQKFEYLIRKQGYFGRLSFWLVGYEKTFPADLLNEYWNAGFLLHTEGDKDAIEHVMFVDILFWALRNTSRPGNLLVISENKNFGQDKFATLRQSMEKNGYYVTLAHLESVIKVVVPSLIDPPQCRCPIILEDGTSIIVPNDGTSL